MSTEDIQSAMAFVTTMPSSLSTPAIVGRQRELTLAFHYYEAAKHGQANVVLVSGEPGIGKTRFLDEVARYASHDGAVVLRGGSSESESMPPFLPFLEALGSYIQHTSLDQLQEQIGPISPLLAHLLPEVTVRLGVQPEPSFMFAEQARYRFYEAVGIFLETIGAPRALVLILDDLHWADSASLDLLCHMARRHVGAHLLLLGAYRDCEVDTSSVLAHAITELSRLRVLTAVSLDPLSAEEINALAESQLGGPLAPPTSSLLSRQSEGNPFFAEELLRCWIEVGALMQANQQWIAVDSLIHTLPPSIIGALRQRFARISPASIDHLRVAAIIGRTFDLSLLATVLEEEVEVVEEYLLEAAHAQLIHAEQVEHFTFSHDKIRECLYIEVSTSRRRRLHERIGQILMIRYEQERSPNLFRLAELAFHFVHSSEQGRSIDYAQRVSTAEQDHRGNALHPTEEENHRDSALHLSDSTGKGIHDAMHHYRIALELLDPHDRRCGNLLFGLGEAALFAGQEEEAEITYTRAQAAFLRVGDLQGAARAAHSLGIAQWRQEKLLAASSAFQHALALFGDTVCADVVRVLVNLSTLLTNYLGEPTTGTSYAQRALDLARSLGETRLEASASRTVAINPYLQSTDLSASILLLERALHLAETSDDLLEAGQCCLSLAMGYTFEARITLAVEISLRQIALSEQCQQNYLLRTTYSWQVLVYATQGEWNRADQMAKQAQQIVDQLCYPAPRAFLHQMRGFLAYQREDYWTAERELQEAPVSSQSSPATRALFYVGLLGLVQAMLGKRAEVCTCLIELERYLADFPLNSLPTAPIMVMMAMMALVQEDREQATKLYTPLLVFQGQHHWFLVDRVLGFLAISRGESDLAMMHLVEAEAIARREHLLPELARILHGQAIVVQACGRQAYANNAQELFTQAYALYKELGMTISAKQLQPQLCTANIPTRPTLPAHLTLREAEVLKLVAQGKSNRQIAHTLGLTEKTVTNHLTHILRKTNCENRASATAFAFRHGLT